MSRDAPRVGAEALHVREYVRQSVISGTAIVVPVLVTGVVLLIALDLLAGLLDPLVIPIREALGGPQDNSMLAEVIAFVVVVVTIVVVGALNESTAGENRIQRGLETTMSRIPGIGSIYGPLDRISRMLLEGDTDNFQEVVLVEYPETGSYCVAFKTAEPPANICDAVHHDDMITVFMPMGPNPFMGGFIMHVSEEDVYHVDLTVEEGITSVVSFGVAVESDDHHEEVIDHLDRYEDDD